MAVAIKAGQEANANSGASSTTLALTLPAAPTAGNMLVMWMAGDKDTGALTLAGFTQRFEILGASVSLYCYYKISDGSETTINPSWATSSAAGNTAYYAELEDSAVSGSTWEVAGFASTAYSDTAVSSRSSNTTGTLTNAALALAGFAVDSSTSVASPAYSNSYVAEYEALSLSGRGAIFVASKSVASGTTECTFSFTGSDQTSGAVVAFAKLVEGGSGGRYLLESGAPDGYLLEDGTGILRMEGAALITVSFTSAVTQADTFGRTATLVRTQAEAVAQSDAWTRVGTFSRAWTSAVAQADVWMQSKVLVRDWAEAVAQADAWTQTKVLARTWAEAVAQADVWTRLATLNRSLISGVTQSDAWTRIATLARTLTEAVVQADVWTASKVIARTFTTTVTQASAFTRVATLSRTLTSTVTQSDAWTRVGTFVRTWVGAVVHSDAWEASTQAALDLTLKVVATRITGPGAPAAGGVAKVDSAGIAAPGDPAAGGAPKVTQQ